MSKFAVKIAVPLLLFPDHCRNGFSRRLAVCRRHLVATRPSTRYARIGVSLEAAMSIPIAVNLPTMMMAGTRLKSGENAGL